MMETGHKSRCQASYRLGVSGDDLNNYERRILGGPVGNFGRYLMERAYDTGMRSAEGTLSGHWKSARAQELTHRLAGLSADEQDAVMAVVRGALIAALHGLLHGLSHDEKEIQLLFEGHNVAQESDGLHGDLFLFLRLLSAYPCDSEDDLDHEAGGRVGLW
jgi:hypothetical protein